MTHSQRVSKFINRAAALCRELPPGRKRVALKQATFMLCYGSSVRRARRVYATCLLGEHHPLAK